MRRLKRWTLAALVIGMVVGPTSPLHAESAAEGEDVAAAPVLPVVTPDDDRYTPGGEATCVECHDESEAFPVLSILKTKHAVQADLRTPLASDYGCQTCHGASAAHIDDESEPPAIAFGMDAPIEPQNEVCMGCHRGGNRINWAGSMHESEDVPCAGCHTIHTAQDPILSQDSSPGSWFRNAQAEVCFGCHMEQRAESFRLSAHPLRDGKMSCSDCHNPHGSMGPSMLAKPTLNETCYTCHAEKRGPFLWEHEPVREDCGACHDPHGSNHRPMLTARGPWLCQQCHMEAYHPSTVYDGQYIVGGGGAGSSPNKLLANECRNCHPEVHGSNHPSGVRWTR